MSFNTRSEFINAQASEKLILVHIHANTRLYNWSVFSGNIYNKVVPHFVQNLKQSLTGLTQVFSIGGLTSNTWFYEIDTSTIYVNLNGTDPNTQEMVCTYRFFFADGPCTLSWDLTDTGDHVYYDARVEDAPGFKHKVGIDQKLVSIVGQGNLKLENNDAGLDGIYDTLIFENQIVEVYSWSRSLPFSDAKIIYRGRVTNKKYTENEIVFTIKDFLYDLLQNVPQDAYDDNDNVNDSVKGRYKRWIYGRVDGLQLQSIDQINGGYNITGTVSIGVDGPTLTGVGTFFLSECSPDDKITIGTQEFSISSIESDTSLTLSDTPTYSSVGQIAQLKPDIPVTSKNRQFLVAGHACARLTKQVVQVKQLNRIVLNNTDGLESGDFVEFNTGERIEIKNIAPGNIIVLRQNIIVRPTVGTDVIRQPVQSIYVKSEEIDNDLFTITNNSNETTVTLASNVEYQIATTENLGFSATFTNGTRDVSTVDDIDLKEILKPRDWIKPDNLSYTTFYEVLSVDTQSIKLRTNFTDATITEAVEGKRPDYIGDDTIVSANVLGRTEDNDPDGTWIYSASQTVNDLLSQVNITNLNAASFTTTKASTPQVISLALPYNQRGNAVTIKSALDKITQSTSTALTLNSDLEIQFKSLIPEISDNIQTISDRDVINWSIESVNGDLIRNALIRYKHKDIDRYTLEAGNSVKTYSSDFVQTYVGTNSSYEVDAYLYKDIDADTLSHREVYFRSLARAQIKIKSDLRLENFNIGDVVAVDFARLYKRFGDSTSRKKVCVIVGRVVDGSEITLELSDVGNIYNRSSIITPNTAPDYNTATEEEKLKYGYITDNNGITNNDENTSNIHLIS